jgi:Skp family chaperone for outer membrane proteins
MSKRMLLACVVLCGAQHIKAEDAKAQPAPVQATAAQPVTKDAPAPANAVSQAAAPAEAGVKTDSLVLYIDMQQAMLQSKQGAEAQRLVEAEEKKYAELAQKAQQDMIKVKTDLDQKGSALAPEARRTQEKKLNDMQRDFQNNVKDWQGELQFTMQRETDAMIKEIEIAAKELAIQTGKKAVIDAQTGRALYLQDGFNSTNDLIAVMNKQFDAKYKQKPAATK